METWRIAWRDGFIPQFSTEVLASLLDALRRDDIRLLSGGTELGQRSVWPPTSIGVYPVAMADVIGWFGWLGEDRNNDEVDAFVGAVCFAADELLIEHPTVWSIDFFRWYDQTPRDVVFRELIGEIETEIQKRRPTVATESCPYCGKQARHLIDDMWQCDPCDKTWSLRVMVFDDDEADAAVQADEIGGEG